MSNNTSQYLQAFLPLIIIFFFIWFFMMRPQKKKDNETKRMRNSLAEGDEVITIGGIVGRVLSVKEDSVVIYVGSDKVKMEFKKWAIGEVTKKAEKPEKAEKAEKAVIEEEEAPKKKLRRLSRKSESDGDLPGAE